MTRPYAYSAVALCDVREKCLLPSVGVCLEDFPDEEDWIVLVADGERNKWIFGEFVLLLVVDAV